MSNVKRLPASLVSQWIRTTQPVGAADNASPNYCWTTCAEDWEEEKWQSVHGSNVQTWFDLGDRINATLHQIDNTMYCGQPSLCSSGLESSYQILEMLVKYHLIYLDIPAIPCTPNQLFQEAEEALSGYGSLQPLETRDRLIEWAFINDRWDILATFELGKEAPPIRSQYWYKKYSEQLGKKDIDYWEWLPNKESKGICEELTALLSLPEPYFEAHEVLKGLSTGIDPFSKDGCQNISPSLSFLYKRVPKFFGFEESRRIQLRTAFRDWHYQAVEKLGEAMMERIYKRCYNTSYATIEAVLNNFSGTWYEVLGVAQTASPATVKAAWKKLAKKYHPDSKTGSTAKMTAINNAFDEFKKEQAKSTQTVYHAYRVNL